MDSRSLDLARDLRDCAELRLQLRRAHVAKLAAAVGRVARAGWTVDDVLARIAEYVAEQVARFGRYTTPTPPDLPHVWISRVLAGADPDVPTAQLARAVAEQDRARIAAQHRVVVGLLDRSADWVPSDSGRRSAEQELAALRARLAARPRQRTR